MSALDHAELTRTQQRELDALRKEASEVAHLRDRVDVAERCQVECEKVLDASWDKNARLRALLQDIRATDPNWSARTDSGRFPAWLHNIFNRHGIDPDTLAGEGGP